MMMEFVTSNFWQTLATHHVDLEHETRHLYEPRDAPLEDGDVIFVKTDLLDAFCADHLPQISKTFTLVTGHSDLSPSAEALFAIDASPRVRRWFAVNAAWTNYKTTCIPLCLAEPCRPHGDQAAVARCAAAVAPEAKLDKVLFPRTAATHPFRLGLDAFEHPAVVKIADRMPYEAYLTELARYRYALCPRGNGIDVHRVYEAILMKTIPVYVTDCMPPALYQHLPVVVVRSVGDLPAALDALDPAAAAAVDWDAAQRFCRTGHWARELTASLSPSGA